MLQIKFYKRDVCPLCDDALAILELFKEEFPYVLEERDIYTNDEWLEKYHLMIPVIEIGDQQLHAGQISYGSIEALLKKKSSF